MKVLIVGEDRVTRMQINAALRRGGFEVEWGSDVETAFARLARAGRPEVVILERVVETAAAPGLIRRLREIAGGRLHVVALSLRSESADVAEWLDAGADDYVLKPADPVVLRARVRAAARRLAREAELEARIRALERRAA